MNIIKANNAQQESKKTKKRQKKNVSLSTVPNKPVVHRRYRRADFQVPLGFDPALLIDSYNEITTQPRRQSRRYGIDLSISSLSHEACFLSYYTYKSVMVCLCNVSIP